jgi:hypothetical protein
MTSGTEVSINLSVLSKYRKIGVFLEEWYASNNPK